MRLSLNAVMWSLGAVLAVLTMVGCDTSVPTDATALPRARAPREWAMAHAKETGAPSATMPKQQAPNQGGADATRR